MKTQQLDEIASAIEAKSSEVVQRAQSKAGPGDPNVGEMVDHGADIIASTLEDMGIEVTPETTGAVLAVLTGLQGGIERASNGDTGTKVMQTAIMLPATVMSAAVAYKSARVNDADIATEMDFDSVDFDEDNEEAA